MKIFHALFFLVLFYSATIFSQNQFDQFVGVDFSTDKAVDFKQYKGELIYLDFWASWCSPCRESFPVMEQLHQSYGLHGLKIIAVNVDENKIDAAQFLSQYPISFQNLYDPEGKIAKQLKVKNMPTAFLISRQGEIVFKHVGFDRDYSEKLKQMIISQLDSK